MNPMEEVTRPGSFFAYELIHRHRPLEALPECGIENLGGRHELPQPALEEEGRSFLHFSSIYAPRFMEIRTVKLPGTTEFSSAWCKAWIWWFHDRAWAVVHPPYSGEWMGDEKGPRYFRLGCPHTFRELSQVEARQKGHSHFGMCYHVYECSKCGSTHSTDSSD